MRQCVTRITYPAWAELIPSFVQLVSQYDKITHLSAHPQATCCITLQLITTPQHFDPLKELDSEPYHLNRLESYLRQRCIPFDISFIDLDRPWRDTVQTITARLDDYFHLIDREFLSGEPPLWLSYSLTHQSTSIIIACLRENYLTSDDFAIACHLAQEVPFLDISHIVAACMLTLNAAEKLDLLERHGLPLDTHIFQLASTQLANKHHAKEVLLSLESLQADRTYRALIKKLTDPQPG